MNTNQPTAPTGECGDGRGREEREMIKLAHNANDGDAIDLMTEYVPMHSKQPHTVVWATLHCDFFNDGADSSVGEALNSAGVVECVLLTKAAYDVMVDGMKPAVSE